MPTRITPVSLMRPSTPLRGAGADAPADPPAGVDVGVDGLVLVVVVGREPGIRLRIWSRYVQPA
jgi:hypothetical protein